MKKYELSRSGANEYANDIEAYYYRQLEKYTLWDNGWISHFTIMLRDKWYNDEEFLSKLFKHAPYAIGRTLLYDSEGYMHALQKVGKEYWTN